MREFTSATAAARGEKIRFKLDGVEFAAARRVSGLALSEWSTWSDLDVDDPRTAKVIHESFVELLGPVEYQRLREHIRRHDTDDELLLEILEYILEEITGRPTRRPSGSSDGPSTTGGGSTGGSSPAAAGRAGSSS